MFLVYRNLISSELSSVQIGESVPVTKRDAGISTNSVPETHRAGTVNLARVPLDNFFPRYQVLQAGSVVLKVRSFFCLTILFWL